MDFLPDFIATMSKILSKKHLCKAAGIKKTRTAPYHPMVNGQAECFNHTLLLMLGTFEPPKRFDWKSYV